MEQPKKGSGGSYSASRGARSLVAASHADTPRWQLPLGRAVASAGAALFVYAAFQPWVDVTAYYRDSAGLHSASTTVTGDQLTYPALPMLVSGAPRIVAALVPFVWIALIAGGALLAPILWMRFSRRGTRLAWWMMLAWLACALAGAVVAIAAEARFLKDLGKQLAAAGFAEQFGWQLDSHLVLVGLALTLAALGILVSGALGRNARTGVRGSAAMAAPHARRSLRRLAPAALVSAGLLVWALGFFAVPWATAGCAGLHLSLNHFITQSCAGMDAADALGSSPRVGITAIDVSTSTSQSLTLLYALAAGYTMLVLAVLWRRHLSRSALVGIGTCLLAETVLAGLAARGIGSLLAYPPLGSLATHDPWVVGPGVVIAFAGLTGAWLGLLLLAV